ncbi:mannosyltransferase [Aureobasidium subglaciale]|nr:mannosyltransferase [Aureobasidium subglaciale]
MAPPDRSRSSLMLADIKVLAGLFVAWKLLLLCVAYASPGPGYDTSTTLLLLRAQSAQSESTLLEDLAKRLASKLVRWDALYFVSVAQRGYVFEQEWAWGWGYTKFVGLVSKGRFGASDSMVPWLNSTSVLPDSSLSPLYAQAYAGVLISHVAHLLSVIMLYTLVHQLPILEKTQRHKTAFLAASMHVFSSAGMFMSAPYSESLFSMLNFAGILIHARIPWNSPLEGYDASSLLSLLSSGACFGLATTVRSNGIFSGLIYFHHVYMLLHSRINIRTMITIVFIGLSAMMVLSGMLFPQYMAYQDFCARPSDGEPRPWCSRTLPSVYSWVQEHYWNVGFLRYWTLSNIPLFLLALPMLYVLVGTGLVAPTLNIKSPAQQSKHASVYILCLALPQMLLALLALTTFHVQIVNRIATGYPIWYIVLAATMVSPMNTKRSDKTATSYRADSLIAKIGSYMSKASMQELIFRGMFMYSIIQGGLYASFMPPA